jgi:hypothetical protein
MNPRRLSVSYRSEPDVRSLCSHFIQKTLSVKSCCSAVLQPSDFPPYPDGEVFKVTLGRRVSLLHLMLGKNDWPLRAHVADRAAEVTGSTSASLDFDAVPGARNLLPIAIRELSIRSRNRVCRRPREPEMIAYRLLGVRERWDGCGAHTASRDRGGATAAG